MHHTRALLALITALWGALLLGSSLLWPQGLGYDETRHLDMAHAYAEEPLRFYGPGERALGPEVEGLLEEVGDIPPSTPLALRAVPDRDRRETLGGLREPAPRGGLPNQMVQHPPLAYWLYAAVLVIPGVDAVAWDLQIWLLRLVGVLLLLPVPLLAWAATHRLLLAEGVRRGHAARVALVAAVTPLTMPNLARVGASVANDALLIAAGSVLVYLLVRVMTGDLRLRTGAGVGAALAVAMLTKGFALVFPPFVLAAYLLGARGSGLGRAVPGLTAAAVGGLLGGLWWLRNLVQFGAIQVHGYGQGYMERRWGFTGDADDGRFKDFVGLFVSRFIERIWGGVGLAEGMSPGEPIVYGWFALAAVGLLGALFVRVRRKPGSGSGARWRAAVLTAIVVLTVAVVAKGSLDLWLRRDIGPAAAQGRYVYHLVVGVAAVSVVGWQRLLQSRHWHRMAGYVLAAGLVTDAMAWSVVLMRWHGADGSLFSGLEALWRWSPVDVPVTVALVGGLPLVLGAVTLVALMAPAPGRALGSRRGSPSR